MAYAVPLDVEKRLGRPLSPAESLQVEAWLEDLEAQIVYRIPTFAELVAAGTPSEAVVRAVMCTAIIRVLNNPKGLRQSTVSIDDYSRTETVDTTASSGALYLTDDEWSMLLPGTSGEAFTISPYGAPDRATGWWVHPDAWVPYG